MGAAFCEENCHPLQSWQHRSSHEEAESSLRVCIKLFIRPHIVSIFFISNFDLNCLDSFVIVYEYLLRVEHQLYAMHISVAFFL
jgi:hypothetical protein